MQRNAERGSILIAVLALAILLGFLAAVASVVVRAAHGSGRAFADDIRAELVAKAVIEKMVAENADLRVALGSSLTLPGVLAQGAMQNEAGRVDLNAAPPELIAGVFRLVGIEDELAQQYAARIVDFRDEDDKITRGGAERDAYRAAGRADGPANRPFAHVAELAQVLGIPIAVSGAAARYFTVASKLAELNPMIAEPNILLAIPGTDSGRVADFLKARNTGTVPFQNLVARLHPGAGKYLTDKYGAASRIEIVVAFGPRNLRRFEAIVAPGSGNEPYRIVAWQAGVPPPPPSVLP